MTHPRPSPSARGYGARWQRKRAAFLRAHPLCVLCSEPSTVADHYPLSRKQLEARGVADPDAAQHLRALCSRCHNRETAARQPGGWHTPYARRKRESSRHPGIID